MKRLKAWFHKKIVEAVDRAWSELRDGYLSHVDLFIRDLFRKERDRLATDQQRVQADLKDIFEKMHSDAVLRLATEMKAHMATEQQAFEARVQHTLESCIKDDPSHWRADEQTKTTEEELRKVK